jgi:hypothetical protein
MMVAEREKAVVEGKTLNHQRRKRVLKITFVCPEAACSIINIGVSSAKPCPSTVVPYD